LGDIAMPKNGFNTINCYRDKEMRNRTVYLWRLKFPFDFERG
jgi:hypothetical protein